MAKVLMETYTTGRQTMGREESEFKLYSPYEANGFYAIAVIIKGRVKPEIRCRIICPNLVIATTIWEQLKQECYAVT